MGDSGGGPEQRNILLAIVLSIAIIVGWQFLFLSPQIEQAEEAARQQAATGQDAPDGEAPPAPADDVPQAPGAPTADTAPTDSRAQALARSARVVIDAPRIRGSISLTGGHIDDLSFTDYRETLEPDSPDITFFSPAGAPNAYYARFGWSSADASVALPTGETVWQADGATISPERPLTLTWDNGAGLRFTRRIEIDANYLFTVTQGVVNYGAATVSLFPYGLLSRTGTPPVLGFYILHEGPLGVFEGTLEERDYEEVRDAGKETFQSTGGWMGITDKYWLAALLPDQTAQFDARFFHDVRDETDKYQVDFIRGAIEIAPGGRAEVTDRLFAGAKEVYLLDAYEEQLGIVRLDLAIDWGLMWFLTKPIFYTVDQFNKWLGNFGLAILLLTVCLKLLFFPLANKAAYSMARMRKVQPKVTELREKFADDKQRMQKEMMALYKEEGINPLSGCLPIIPQIPVFFALYKVLFVTIEMRHAPFYGWIADLSAPDPVYFINLFGLIPFDPPGFLAIGIWPVLMAVTMFLLQKLSPPPPDPTQAKIMMFLPLMFLFLFATFPAGLVMYWTWNNVLQIAQQWVIMRRVDKSG
jgi:YidC/Oxa1 family membrane protein insertase